MRPLGPGLRARNGSSMRRSPMQGRDHREALGQRLLGRARPAAGVELWTFVPVGEALAIAVDDV